MYSFSSFSKEAPGHTRQSLLPKIIHLFCTFFLLVSCIQLHWLHEPSLPPLAHTTTHRIVVNGFLLPHFTQHNNNGGTCVSSPLSREDEKALYSLFCFSFPSLTVCAELTSSIACIPNATALAWTLTDLREVMGSLSIFCFMIFSSLSTLHYMHAVDNDWEEALSCSIFSSDLQIHTLPKLLLQIQDRIVFNANPQRTLIPETWTNIWKRSKVPYVKTECFLHSFLPAFVWPDSTLYYF